MRAIDWAKDGAALIKYRFRIRAIAETILVSPQKYEGLYEPVHRLAERKKTSARTLSEWKVRTDYLYPGTALAAFLARFSDAPVARSHPEKVAKVLLRGIDHAGVTRDDIETLTADPLRAGAYHAVDGTAIEEGVRLRVISPAWFLKGLIVEHGIAEVVL